MSEQQQQQQPPPPPPPLPQPPADNQLNGGTVVPPDTVAPKRHRRPSVRLGDIGDQLTYDNNRRTKQHQWKFASKDSKSSKTRPLVNLTGGFQDFGQDDGKDCRDDIRNAEINNNVVNINGGNDNIDGVIGSWKGRDCSKSKRGFSGTKRVRSNWGDEFGHDDDESLNFEMDDEMELNYRGKETRVRVSDGDGLEGPSDTDGRNWNNNNNNININNNNCLERDGVRVWLNQLGLGRYAPVFEVHEVDDEVLPLLTLEDLKDMGINAVGSRRKMFCSIQKLGKGFS